MEGTVRAAGPEEPEVTGGPYLVYRTSGVIVRLGEPPVSVRAGGALGRRTYTDDGTVWVHRPDTGAVCALRRGADALDCARHRTGPARRADGGHVVGRLPRHRRRRRPARGRGPRTPTGVGVDLPDAALISDRDTRGRLPAVEPGRLVLADSAGIPTGAVGGTPCPAPRAGPRRWSRWHHDVRQLQALGYTVTLTPVA
jgi:hypothetical protein